MNIAILLEMAADAFGERIAVTCADRSVSYAQLRAAAQAAAQHLHGGTFAHLALLESDGLAAAVALFAAAYAGVPYVPLSYRLTGGELTERLERIAPAWLVADPAQLARLKLPAGIACGDAQTLAGGGRGDGSGGGGGAAPSAPPDTPGAVAVQLFTSGTSGAPKAALLRHEHLMSYILGTVEFGAAGHDEAALVAVPPYHIAGIAAVLSSTYAGRRIVMLPAFEPSAWLELIARERISHAFLVPTMLVRILDALGQPGAPALPSLRAIAYGGGRMPLNVIERALAAFPDVDFTNAYGLTETSATICLLTPEDHRAAASARDPQLRRRLASVGRPLATVEIEVRDESGRVLGPQVPGLIFVRGAQVAGEYRGAGRVLDSGGWFATQDRGWRDADGYLFLEGRADDVIVRGGENISPGEIEEVLLAHPAVADAVVVAVPSEEWGEAAAAAVVLRSGCAVDAATLREWVRARLRSSRVPERVVFKGELPYNDMGKVLRRAVRQELLG